MDIGCKPWVETCKNGYIKRTWSETCRNGYQEKGKKHPQMCIKQKKEDQKHTEMGIKKNNIGNMYNVYEEFNKIIRNLSNWGSSKTVSETCRNDMKVNVKK